MKKFLKKLFCWHSYNECNEWDWFNKAPRDIVLWYSVIRGFRFYECRKCGKLSAFEADKIIQMDLP